jgi:hypothetical protein
VHIADGLDGFFLAEGNQMLQYDARIDAKLGHKDILKHGKVIFGKDIPTVAIGFLKDPEILQGSPDAARFEDAPLVLSLDVTPEMRLGQGVPYSMELTAEARVTDAVFFPPTPPPTDVWQSVSGDAGNSLELMNVLFELEDGSFVTPESMGVQLTFDSGIISPNVIDRTAVPEPSTFLLGEFCAAGWLLLGRKRRASTMRVKIGDESPALFFCMSFSASPAFLHHVVTSCCRGSQVKEVN